MEDSERDRKRIKRDMHTCLQCRRRKVKCTPALADNTTCAECAKRGLQCAPYRGDAGSEDRDRAAQDQKSEETLHRIESLLKTLVDRHGSGRDTDDTSASAAPAVDVINSIADACPAPPIAATDPAMLFSKLQPNMNRQTGLKSHALTHTDTIRSFLASLLPSQRDVDTIMEHTLAWALSFFNPMDARPTPNHRGLDLNIARLAKTDPMVIGLNLVYLAICIQQLPPDFDVRLLEMHQPELFADKYVTSVGFTTHTDEFVLCPTGLRYLLALGMYHINGGDLRRAWTSFRRAIDVGRALGFHRSYSVSERDLMDDDTVLRRRLWLHAVMGDCFVSPLMSLEHGSGSQPFGVNEPAWVDASVGNTEYCQRRLCGIAAKLTLLDASLQQQSYGPIEVIDMELDKLRDVLPVSWWTSPRLTNERSSESAAEFNRFLAQMWYFHLRIATHLLYYFSVSVAKKFEYCRGSCLEASRSILHRYLILRELNNSELHCKVVDFSAFFAAATILLLDIEDASKPSGTTVSLKESDGLLVDRTMHSMDALGRASNREVVAKQSFEVLTALKHIALQQSPSPRDDRLRIPGLGMVQISCSNAGGPTSVKIVQGNHGTTASREADVPQPSSGCAAGASKEMCIRAEESLLTAAQHSELGFQPGLTDDSIPGLDALNNPWILDFDSLWDPGQLDWQPS